MTFASFIGQFLTCGSFPAETDGWLSLYTICFYKGRIEYTHWHWLFIENVRLRTNREKKTKTKLAVVMYLDVVL